MFLDPSHYLKIVNTKVYNEKVRNDLKIAAVGDFHLSKMSTDRTLDFLKYQLDFWQPHYICLLGDLVDSPLYLDDNKIRVMLTNFIQSISSICPVFIVLGSHDYVIDNTIEKVYAYKDYWNELNNLLGVHLLKNEFYCDDSVLVMGYFLSMPYYYNKEYVDRLEDLNYLYYELLNQAYLYENMPTSVPTIGLIHSPFFVNDRRIVNLLSNYDLFLAGHYHEGCMPVILDDIMPGNFGISGPRRKLFPKIARGTVELSTGTKLILNGGIIKLQECAPRWLRSLNHLCYQHLDFVTLSAEIDKSYEVSQKRIYTRKNY